MIATLDPRRLVERPTDCRPAAAGPQDEAPVLVHVQLRPRHAALRRFWTGLRDLAAEHAGVPLAVAGLARDARGLRVTLAVDLGPARLIARRSEAAVGAFHLVQALFDGLGEHLPQYAAAPGDAERAEALALFPVRLPVAAPVVLPAPRRPLGAPLVAPSTAPRSPQVPRPRTATAA